ncbi:efflux RND transporter periplasmic adaptor subunit [Pseudoduganella chitinolytica]|uniref:Efflux RND transporter periplasmic adaptor subunit n=1 Tax=Pseudoduganella chitinolytica TaxID=34070 RepID=A0ABY8B810_9BURK|nr:efflux RND transporter periplasmic adaptor subunit [Pseudoduganella chitinolytica]WEF31553.1 efflux RND transporter periplasmic adaptor subunit [Pseudoduganella chitinolytica]
MLRNLNSLVRLELACVVTAALSLQGCNSSVASAGGSPPAPEVSVASVQVRQVQSWDEFNGRVGAVESVSIRPRVSGYIERVAFREGDDIKKGDLLFLIDQRPYQAVANSAQAQLERARAAADLAKTQIERAQTLIGANAISREEFDSRKAALAQAVADVHGAEAQLAKARLDLTFTEVRAPIGGRVSNAMLTAGNLAQADQSVLTTVVSQESMYVYFDCDERSYQRYLDRVRGDRRAERLVKVGLADETGFSRTGKVDFLDNRLDANMGTIRARALLPNADRKLTPGMYARVKLDGSGEFKAMLVDDRAVLTDQDRKYLYVVGPENKALRKDVVLGRLIDDGSAGPNAALRVVESGLESGDKVIVGGTQKIFFPGMPVKPIVLATSAQVAAAKTSK